VVGRLPLVVDVGRFVVVVDVGLLVDVGLFAGLVVGLFVGRPVLIVPPPMVPPPLAGSCCANTLPALMNNRLVNTVREIRGRRRVNMSCSPAARMFLRLRPTKLLVSDCVLLSWIKIAYCCWNDCVLLRLRTAAGHYSSGRGAVEIGSGNRDRCVFVKCV